MADIDWHAGRGDLSGLAFLDLAPESEGIDLRAVRRYRQARVRSEMARQGIDAVILSDPVNIRYATGTRTEHGEKEDRHVVMSIKVQDAKAAALSAPGRATRTFRKPPPRATPHSGSSASSDTTAVRSSSLMSTAAARRRNSGVSTRQYIRH